MNTPLRLRAAADTHPGLVYQVNQDNACSLIRSPTLGDTLGLFIVADGMGGHQAGEVASKLAVDTIHQELAWLLHGPDNDSTDPNMPAPDDTVVDGDSHSLLERRLRIAVEQANRAIYSYAQENVSEAGNLGTTVTAVLVKGTSAVIANVGDSRTYLLRDGALRQLTDDHSYVARLVRSGQLEPEDIYDHPRRNVITRSVGHDPEVTVDTDELQIESGDRLLLCSDGLWEMVRDQTKIAGFISETGEPERAVAELIDAANAGGGADNIGVVVVFVEEGDGEPLQSSPQEDG